jgi:hypothetical protein
MSYEASCACTVCEMQAPGMVTYHHIYTRKAYPEYSSEKFNLMPLCAWHHVEIHKSGTVSFAKKYPAAHDFLISNGWLFAMGKWIYPKLDRLN